MWACLTHREGEQTVMLLLLLLLLLLPIRHVASHVFPPLIVHVPAIDGFLSRPPPGYRLLVSSASQTPELVVVILIPDANGTRVEDKLKFWLANLA